mgnify:CR=1 FL=1
MDVVNFFFHYVENLGVGELANVNVLLPQLQYALLCTKFNKTVALDTCCTQLHLQSMLTTDTDIDRWIIDERIEHYKEDKLFLASYYFPNR